MYIDDLSASKLSPRTIYVAKATLSALEDHDGLARVALWGRISAQRGVYYIAMAFESLAALEPVFYVSTDECTTWARLAAPAPAPAAAPAPVNQPFTGRLGCIPVLTPAEELAGLSPGYAPTTEAGRLLATVRCIDQTCRCMPLGHIIATVNGPARATHALVTAPDSAGWASVAAQTTAVVTGAAVTKVAENGSFKAEIDVERGEFVISHNVWPGAATVWPIDGTAPVAFSYFGDGLSTQLF